MKRFMTTAFVAVLALSLIPVMAQATIVFDMSLIYGTPSGTPAGSPGTIVRATFDDTVGDLNVDGFSDIKLTLEDVALGASEFVDGTTGVASGGGWFFNVLDETKLGSLVFASLSGNAADAIVQTADGFQADGDGKFDIKFAWINSGAGGRLSQGENAIYRISLPGTNLSASFFDVFSTPAGGFGPFKSAVHIQGISGGGSAWVAPGGGNPIPEPSTLLLLGTGLLGLVAISRKKRKK
jgi:hypothetical protein